MSMNSRLFILVAAFLMLSSCLCVSAQSNNTSFREDLNNDGDVNVGDVIQLVNVIMGSSESVREMVYDKLKGKKVNFLGDSYVANDDNGFEKTWEYKVCDRNGMLARNYGINGNGIVAEFLGTPMVQRYVDMDDDADYVIVVGGENDYNKQISIDNFKNGLATLILGLVNKYIARGTKIAFFTPWKIYLTDADDRKDIKLQRYVDAIVEVCNQYSVPVFDSSKRSSVFMYNPKFREVFSLTPKDKSHLNDEGHNYFLPKAEAFIRSL